MSRKPINTGAADGIVSQIHNLLTGKNVDSLKFPGAKFAEEERRVVRLWLLGKREEKKARGKKR